MAPTIPTDESSDHISSASSVAKDGTNPQEMRDSLTGSVSGQCTQVKRNGQRCGARALIGSSLCYFHDPASARARAAASKRGGERNHVAVLPSATADFPLNRAKDAVALLALTINQVLRGQIDPKDRKRRRLSLDRTAQGTGIGRNRGASGGAGTTDGSKQNRRDPPWSRRPGKIIWETRMSTHKKRLDKIEGTMSPCELVLVLVNKARSSGSLQKSMVWYNKNSARVIAQMETAVSDRQRDDPPSVLAKSIRAVRTETAFLIQLWIACNECNRELVDRCLPQLALFEASVRAVHYLCRSHNHATSATLTARLGSRELIDQAKATRELGEELLEELLATRLAIATISQGYFREQPLIFGGRDEKLSDRIDFVETSCELYNRILAVAGQYGESNLARGLPGIDVAKVSKAAEARVKPTVDDLLAAARNEAFLNLDPIAAMEQKRDTILGKGQI